MVPLLELRDQDSYQEGLRDLLLLIYPLEDVEDESLELGSRVREVPEHVLLCQNAYSVWEYLTYNEYIPIWNVFILIWNNSIPYRNEFIMGFNDFFES